MMVSDAKRLVEVYRGAELQLLGLIRSCVAREAFGSARYYRHQLHDLRATLARVEATIRALQARTDDVVPLLVQQAYEQGVISVGAVATAVDHAAMGVLVAETKTALRKHLLQVRRETRDLFDHVTRVAVEKATTTGANHRTVLRDALNTAADEGLTGFVDRSGRRWRMDSYLDMSLRTVQHHARTQGRIDGWQQLGVELVRVSTHPACAPQCRPFQGRVLALSGGAGARMVFDHDGVAQAVNVVATMQEALARGYKHPNCRHTETVFLFGSDDTSPSVSEEEHDKEYRVLQRQRRIEREIRRWKRREAVAMTSSDRDVARGRVLQLQADQRDHVKRHRYLTREYGREQVGR